MFFKFLGRVIFAQRYSVFRFAVIIYVFTAAFLTLSQPAAVAVSVSSPKLKIQPITEETGLGGGWYPEQINGIIFENESLVLEENGVLEPEAFSGPQVLLYSTYILQKNDIIGNLAASFGLSEDTLLSANNIKNARLLQIGQLLLVPNQDGVLYTVKRGETLEEIADRYSSDITAICQANELFSSFALPGSKVFIPGAKLDWMERQEINGDLFIWPVSGIITSPYGNRANPFGGNRSFHTGIDIGAPRGTPVRAAMSGRVSSAGYDSILGNFVVVTHHSGYRTMYGHMSVIRVKSGAYVGTGERIGDVGSTGQSTGNHLHFTVYKNGVTVNPRSVLK
ncbi:MAG: M23 family metallopeptidase [Treponema sp.]|nr:M23 family metallopeptidase [Treponema sp.]